jgi:hypothetical protein
VTWSTEWFFSFFSHAMRRAPLLTLWGKIGARAARAVCGKVLAATQFGERVMRGVARIVFFPTGGFRGEKLRMGGGQAMRGLCNASRA